MTLVPAICCQTTILMLALNRHWRLPRGPGATPATFSMPKPCSPPPYGGRLRMWRRTETGGPATCYGPLGVTAAPRAAATACPSPAQDGVQPGAQAGMRRRTA